MKKSTILRTLFVSSVMLLAMLAYEIANSYMLSQKVIKTNATPITNKTIVLDAGHGLPDEGKKSLHRVKLAAKLKNI